VPLGSRDCRGEVERVGSSGSREKGGRLGTHPTGGLHLSGKKSLGVTVREKTEWAVAGLASLGLLGPLLLSFYPSFFLFFSGFLNLL
jgi:hypothetical protein